MRVLSTLIIFLLYLSIHFWCPRVGPGGELGVPKHGGVAPHTPHPTSDQARPRLRCAGKPCRRALERYGPLRSCLYTSGLCTSADLAPIWTALNVENLQTHVLMFPKNFQGQPDDLTIQFCVPLGCQTTSKSNQMEPKPVSTKRLSGRSTQQIYGLPSQQICCFQRPEIC